ncbi:MAG: aminopeptidase N [Xanthomonadales bacterium]|nr:aminopeptidase N [Xanthomonadales bacterium]
MKEGTTAHAVYRKDYTPYPWKLEQVRLRFEIAEECTRVHSCLELQLVNPEASAADIELDGEDMELVSIRLDDRPLNVADYSIGRKKLTVHNAPACCRLELEVLIKPVANTALEGLYPSGHFLLTQCEAQGFRKITYFPDRPDVMTKFDVTLEADRGQYPVLLCNGNAVDAGDGEVGRHWVRWNDPFAKPSYLFALVAGDLECVEDHYSTRSGREVTLRIYVETENLDRCDHAMESLIHAMRWDEERFGLEYDLDIYHIVATNDFNMGAMENKSLNIFNSKYVLARPDTATDLDYQGIEGVIGHEYFHNWTGNRVTCRDWFQLTLKEGLTVFRDQEFSSDMHSRAVKRIRDVRDLRSRQFPEDCGPMSHPIRPEKYMEINNFYTMTVYQKGAEVIRMYHTLLGEEGFQKGMRLYFERHDGKAVTCDDFLAAMADANGADLENFGRWYRQSGTPEVRARGDFDPERNTYTLHLSQHTPPTQDQAEKQAMVIPVAVGLLSSAGQELPLRLEGQQDVSPDAGLLLLEECEQRFVFADIPEEPVPSLLRNFSAPVKFEFAWSTADLALLMAHDSDSFMRWEAAQLLAQRQILANCERYAAGSTMRLEPALVEAFSQLLADTGSDPALLAEAMTLPGEEYLGGQLEIIDVDAVHAARKFVKSELANRLADAFRACYDALDGNQPHAKSPRSMARRSLKNTCLSYLLETPAGHRLAEAQLDVSDNMTDTLAALKGLAWSGAPAAKRALEAFEQQWQDDALVMDKWFSIQASVPGAPTVERVRELLGHPRFSITNPNKVRSLIGVFSMLNPTGFHAADGSGYRLHADQVLILNGLNPQIAARMAGAFNQWRRYDDSRRAMMKTELNRIVAADGLSPDVGEIVRSALAMEEASPS